MPQIDALTGGVCRGVLPAAFIALLLLEHHSPAVISMVLGTLADA